MKNKLNTPHPAFHSAANFGAAISFYLIGIRSRKKKNGVTACFACQSRDNNLQHIWLEATDILKLFKHKCIVTEVNQITPEQYCKIYDVDIASAVNAVQKHEKIKTADRLKKFFLCKIQS